MDGWRCGYDTKGGRTNKSAGGALSLFRPSAKTQLSFYLKSTAPSAWILPALNFMVNPLQMNLTLKLEENVDKPLGTF